MSSDRIGIEPGTVRDSSGKLNPPSCNRAQELAVRRQMGRLVAVLWCAFASGSTLESGTPSCDRPSDLLPWRIASSQNRLRHARASRPGATVEQSVGIFYNCQSLVSFAHLANIQLAAAMHCGNHLPLLTLRLFGVSDWGASFACCAGASSPTSLIWRSNACNSCVIRRTSKALKTAKQKNTPSPTWCGSSSSACMKLDETMAVFL